MARWRGWRLTHNAAELAELAGAVKGLQINAQFPPRFSPTPRDMSKLTEETGSRHGI